MDWILLGFAIATPFALAILAVYLDQRLKRQNATIYLLDACDQCNAGVRAESSVLCHDCLAEVGAGD